MSYHLDAEAEHRLDEYFADIGAALNNKKRRASFAIYAMGLLGHGERKSVEPIAARTCPEPERVDALQQQLGHFLTDSEWSDRAVRRVAARYAVEAMGAQEP